MEITIHNNDVAKTLKESYKIFLRPYLRKSLLRISLIFLGGVLFLFMGINDSANSLYKSTTQYAPDSTMIKIYITPVWGIACLMICFFLLIDFIKQYANLMQQVNETSRDHLIGNNSSTVRITDEMVFYNDALYTSESKWSIFKRCELKNDFLFLYRLHSKSSFPAIAIYKRQMSERDFQELLSFLRKKFIIKGDK